MEKKETERRLGIYVRQSKEKETNGSIEDQIKQGIRKADFLKIPYTIYEDKGITAAGDFLTKRPECSRMMNDIEKNIISEIFVYDLSRLSRNAKTDLFVNLILQEYNIMVYTVLDGTIDLQDSDGIYLSGLKALNNQKFIRDQSKKIKGVLLNRVEDGKAHGSGMKPYGYTADSDKNLIIDEEEAKVVVKIFNMCLNGLGSGMIAKELNKLEIPTRGRKVLKKGITYKLKNSQEIRKHIPSDKIKWAGNTVLTILKSTIVKGERVYLSKIYPAPAIIDLNTWNKAQEQITKNRNKTGPKKHKYLLNELCYCGHCTSKMLGRTRLNKRDNYYSCVSKRDKEKKCTTRSLNIDYLNEVVWYAIYL